MTEVNGVTETLAEPLQCCEFEPSINPRYLAIGGEDVHLSVFEINKLFPAREGDDSLVQLDEGGNAGPSNGNVDEEEGQNDITEHLSNVAKKRKRSAEQRSKARELVKGEIWRAKNVSVKK